MASTGDRPYDPYIPAEPAAGGAGAQSAPGNQRTAALQAVSYYSFREQQIYRWIDRRPKEPGIDAPLVTPASPRQVRDTKQAGFSDGIDLKIW